MNHESFYSFFFFISSVQQTCILYDHEHICSQGLLREEDLEHFDEDFRKNFKSRQADIFSEDGWEGDD